MDEMRVLHYLQNELMKCLSVVWQLGMAAVKQLFGRQMMKPHVPVEHINAV